MIELGGFNADYMPSLDYAFIIKYTDMYGAICNPMPLFYYRFSNVQTSNVCWTGFIENAIFYRDCMIRHIKFPSLYLKALSNSISHYIKEYEESYWGNCDAKYITKFDKYFVSLSRWWRVNIKPYKYYKK